MLPSLAGVGSLWVGGMDGGGTGPGERVEDTQVCGQHGGRRAGLVDAEEPRVRLKE